MASRKTSPKQGTTASTVSAPSTTAAAAATKTSKDILFHTEKATKSTLKEKRHQGDPGATALRTLSIWDKLPDDALAVDVRALAVMSGRGVSTIWRLVAAGAIPRPTKLGPRTSRWTVQQARSLMGPQA